MIYKTDVIVKIIPTGDAIDRDGSNNLTFAPSTRKPMLLKASRVEIDSSMDNTPTIKVYLPKKGFKIANDFYGPFISYKDKEEFKIYKYDVIEVTTTMTNVTEPAKTYSSKYTMEIQGYSLEGNEAIINADSFITQLKRMPKIKQNWASGLTFRSLIEHIIPTTTSFYDKFIVNNSNLESQVWDCKINDLTMNDYLSPWEILVKLQERFTSLYFYLRNDADYKSIKFYCGFKYFINNNNFSQRLKFAYPYKEGYNVITESGLKYNLTDKNNILVSCSFIKEIPAAKDAIKKDNVKVPVSLYYSGCYLTKTNDKFNGVKVVDGKNVSVSKSLNDFEETRNTKVKNGLDETSAKRIIQEVWNQIPERGYTGQFKTLGAPNIRKGDIVILNVDGNEGSYIIKSISIDVSVTNGYRRTIELESQIQDRKTDK